MNPAGMKIETTELIDRKLVIAFLLNTALNWDAKLYLQWTLGSLISGMSGTLPLSYSASSAPNFIKASSKVLGSKVILPRFNF